MFIVSRCRSSSKPVRTTSVDADVRPLLSVLCLLADLSDLCRCLAGFGCGPGRNPPLRRYLMMSSAFLGNGDHLAYSFMSAGASSVTSFWFWIYRCGGGVGLSASHGSGESRQSIFVLLRCESRVCVNVTRLDPVSRFGLGLLGFCPCLIFVWIMAPLAPCGARARALRDRGVVSCLGPPCAALAMVSHDL